VSRPGGPAGRSREQRITQAFVYLADSLGDDFDPPGYLHGLAVRCTDLLGVDGAGVLLADPGGTVRLLASSDEATRLLELFELHVGAGPCLAAYHSGCAVQYRQAGDCDRCWPAFAVRARAAGFRSAHAVPLQRHGRTIGALGLFRHAPEPLTAPRQLLGRALADVATIALLQHRAIDAEQTLAGQLQRAFTTRLEVEQAKGILAERLHIDPEEAFERMRRQARRTNRRLASVAHDLIIGGWTPSDPAAEPRDRRGPADG
jgi:hypothetical protein